MNKRQIKKRNKIIKERSSFFNFHFTLSRKNGKTYIYKMILDAIYSKKYGPFKKLKREFKKYFVCVDVSNGKDMSAETTYYIKNKKAYIVRTRIF